MKFRVLLFLSVSALFSLTVIGQMRAVPPGYSLRADGGVRRAAKLPSGGTVTPAAMREIELEAFRLINEERDEAGLGPLTWSDRVAEVARLHSGNMAEYDFFSHKGLEMILVADGLVLVDLGDQTPVMRAGDALMVRRVAIRGWENLRREPARLFWVVSG